MTATRTFYLIIILLLSKQRSIIISSIYKQKQKTRILEINYLYIMVCIEDDYHLKLSKINKSVALP